MRTRTMITALFIMSVSVPLSVSAENGWFKKTFESIKSSPAAESITQTKLSDTKIGQGLKETLKVGVEQTVKTLGKKDGYFANEAIKIAMPEKLKTLEKGLRLIGFDQKLDEFVLSMNRAAEEAAPFAKDIFYNAIFDLSFDDVQKIYSGGETAATEYFKESTSAKLTETFRPSVEKSLTQFGVTNQYKELIEKYQSIPFAKNLPIPEIEDYVVAKALDGLFFTLGQEEKKIRTDPAARTTDLLKQIFK